MLQYLAIMLWVLALLLGGGTSVGLSRDYLLEIVSVPIIVHCLLAEMNSGAGRNARLPFAIIVATLAVMLLQLLPLPGGLWSLFAVPQPISDVYQAIGASIGWRSISAAPHATVYAIAALLPPIAMFLLVMQLGPSERRTMVFGVIVASAVVVILAMMLVAGESKDFGTLADANRGYAVGPFSNKNHFAALIYCMVPLTVAWTWDQLGRRSARRLVVIGAGVAIVLVLLVGLNVSNSRAGVVLAGVALVLSAIMILSELRGGARRSPYAVGAMAALVLIGIVVLVGSIVLINDRGGATDSARAAMREKSIAIIEEQGGRGTGFGTFVPVYMMHEDINDIIPTYINHVHNDWIETVLEGGFIVIAIQLAALVWWATAAWSVWRRGRGGALAKAATISSLLLMAHSLVDYPLRTGALLVTFAACCAMMCAVRESGREAVREVEAPRQRSRTPRPRSVQAHGAGRAA